MTQCVLCFVVTTTSQIGARYTHPQRRLRAVNGRGRRGWALGAPGPQDIGAAVDELEGVLVDHLEVGEMRAGHAGGSLVLVRVFLAA